MSVNKTYHLYLFYFLVGLGLVSVLFSNPFLRYPYDAFAHLIAIDEMYHHLERTSTSIQNSRLIWHKLWAEIFHLLHLDSQAFFLRAKIIHVTQTYIALLSIYFFSKVLLRNLFRQVNALTIKYLALWSTLIWLTIYGTFSVNHHMIWNLWYSINYQITLPLFFYIVALTLILLLESKPLWMKLFYVLQILLIVRFTLQAHSMEFMYYLLYISLLGMVYYKEIWHVLHKYYLIILPIIFVLIYLTSAYLTDTTKIFKYMYNGSWGALYHDIISIGERIVSHYNRSKFVINELMYLTFYLTIIAMLFYSIRGYAKKGSLLNTKILLFTILSSSLILIPLYIFPAGLFGMITKPHVVHRIYYASSLFVLLPIVVYMITQHFSHKIRYINILLLGVIVSTFIYSYYQSSYRHLYAKNVLSIQKSFQNKYAFHLVQKDLEHIRDTVEYIERHNASQKPLQWFSRADIAFVLKFIYHKKNVHGYKRKEHIDYKNNYQEFLQYGRYNQVLFEDKGLPLLRLYH